MRRLQRSGRGSEGATGREPFARAARFGRDDPLSGAHIMPDQIRTIETKTETGGNSTMAFILGGLVVAGGVIGWVIYGGDLTPAGNGGGSKPNITIQTPKPAAPAPVEPAPAAPTPAEPAPAEPAPAAPPANP